jgi:hypothetical protein
MNSEGIAWLERVLQDLTDFSAELVEPGLAKPIASAAVSGGYTASSLAVLLRSIDEFARQVAVIVSQAEMRDDGPSSELVLSPTAQRSVRSTRPSDYVVQDGRAVPRHWLRREHSANVAPEPLRWLVGLVNRLQQQLTLEGTRLTKQIEQARFTRDGLSEFALADMKTLDAMQDNLVGASRRLRRALDLLATNADSPLLASARLPNPFPAGVSWHRIRVLAQGLDQSRLRLQPWLGQALRAPVPLADVPFLYQRWCGLQILRAAERLGWETRGDAVGALFLGGVVELRRDEDIVELWVEPRLSDTQAKRTGWRSRHNELTPDFLFITGEPGNRDAFVLDATLSTAPDYLADKVRYRDLLEGLDARYIAGVPHVRRPLRSWSAAPIRASHCRVADAHGFGGTIPLNAYEPNFPALEAWLRDVFDHASASRVLATRVAR